MGSFSLDYNQTFIPIFLKQKMFVIMNKLLEFIYITGNLRNFEVSRLKNVFNHSFFGLALMHVLSIVERGGE